MGSITVTINSMKVYQVIGPGHYRAVRFSKFSFPIIEESVIPEIKEVLNAPVACSYE